MTKGDIVNSLYNLIGSKLETKLIVDKTFEIISKALKTGEKVSICRFGNFSILEMKARIGLDFKTGKKIYISPYKRIKFKQSKFFFK
ncbi:MAG: HU family DNA-binding protein [Endomicrobium sp.]|nr:HU family DNA-binding protein [Endomicrobium sp.]